MTIAIDVKQMEILKRGALVLPFPLREFFLQSTAAYLGKQNPSDEDLKRAVVHVLSGFKYSLTSHFFECPIIEAASGCIGLPITLKEDL